MVSYLQKLGRSLMLPVSIMPIAAILRGIGYWIDPIGFGSENVIAAFLIEGGGAIIDHIPFLFAIGIAIGMSNNKDSMIVMCTVVSYLTVDKILANETVALLMNIDVKDVSSAFNSTPNTLIGILIGLLSVYIYNKFSHVELPKALTFFGGKRFPIIVCTFVMLIFSIILLLVWPIIYDGCVVFGEFISKLGPFGAGLYAFFNRLLIPLGLHHPLNSVFWFDVAGINDIGKFWGTIDGGVIGETGMYQAGFFPVMMFGLPAAAIAIYHCARPEKKKQVGAIMLSAAFASFLTGVTEPIEFSFMLVAPALYIVHALFTGIAVFIAATMKWLAGFGFSAGLIDYILSIKSPFANNIYMLLVLGIICGIVYYIVFRFMILHFNFLTPGREIDEKIVDIMTPEHAGLLDSNDYDEIAIFLVESLGGRDNIVFADSCITRLRVQLKDISLIDEDRILSIGIGGIVKVGKTNVQIIIGTQVDFIVDSMNDIIR